MGSVMSLMGLDGSYERSMGSYKANTILQKASNAAEVRITEAKKVLQNARNYSETQITEARKLVQAANNAASERVTAAQRVAQAARNERAAEESTTMRWKQSLDNQRKLAAAGEEANALQVNILHNVDVATTGRAFDRLAAAEELGASLTNAAAAGVGGGSVDAYNNAMRIRHSLMETMEDQAHEGDVINAYAERGAIMQRGVQSLDNNVFSAELDYNELVAPKDFTVYTPELDYEEYMPNLDYTVHHAPTKMSSADRLFTFAAAAGATYFGGPQAGMAVLDIGAGMNDMIAGDNATAARRFESGAAGLYGGFKTYRAGAGRGQVGSAWGANIFRKSPGTGVSLQVDNRA